MKEIKEIEMVVQVNGTSWVGIGWRPNSLTAECKNFPVIKDLYESNVPEAASEPEPEPESSAEPEPTSEPSSEPEPEKASGTFVKLINI